MTSGDSRKGRVIVVYTGSSEARCGLRATVVSLPNPATGARSTMAIIDGHLLELNFFKNKHSAWLAGDQMLSDGALHMATPIDPLLFVLPSGPIQEADASEREARFVDAEELLQCSSQPDNEHLLPLVLHQLRCICDVKQAGGNDYFRLNQTRVLAWLQCKVRQAEVALASETPCPLPTQPAAAQAYAAGIVCEYLSKHWSHLLLASLNGAVEPAQKQSNNVDLVSPARATNYEPVFKKAKVELDSTQKAALNREVSKKAAFAKNAKGSSSIKSFFTKGKT